MKNEKSKIVKKVLRFFFKQKLNFYVIFTLETFRKNTVKIFKQTNKHIVKKYIKTRILLKTKSKTRKKLILQRFWQSKKVKKSMLSLRQSIMAWKVGS